MSDNISVTQGFGTVMATDNIGGVHYPRNKLVFGPDGSQQDVSAAAPLPVSIGSAIDDLATEDTLSEVREQVAKEDTLQALSQRAILLAEQATLAAVDSKLGQVNTNLGVIAGAVNALATEETLASIDGKIAGFATEETLAGIDGKVATQTTLASIDGKIATEATLDSIDGKIGALATEETLASIDGKINVLATEQTLTDIEDILKVVRDAVALNKPTTARQLSAGATSASTSLTSTVRRISIYASGASIRYAVGAGSQTASSASHFIAEGERLTIGVPASASIAAIRAGSVDGVLEISELT